jgi:hypothetical protein
MNLNDRFAVAEDDTEGIYDCMTCCALVHFDRLEDHNHWHEKLEVLQPNIIQDLHLLLEELKEEGRYEPQYDDVAERLEKILRKNE